MFRGLLPKNYGFFDLFDKHAATGKDAVKLLREAFENLSDNSEIIARIEEREHECDTLAHLTIDLLRNSFITPFERDEIRRLILKMDDVIDFVEAAAHRLQLFNITEVPPELIKMSDVLIQAQDEVSTVVGMLRKMKKTEELKEHLKRINSLENECDKIHRQGIAGLFQNQPDPLMVMKHKELIEMLENAVDKCEDVAEVVEGIIIEHAE